MTHGVCDAEIALGQPTGPIPLRLGHGVTRVVVGRPPGVPVRVRVRSGATRLIVDDRRYDAIGGHALLEAPDAAEARDRYELQLAGGATDVTVTAE